VANLTIGNDPIWPVAWRKLCISGIIIIGNVSRVCIKIMKKMSEEMKIIMKKLKVMKVINNIIQ
jgi:hypothetical protein